MGFQNHKGTYVKILTGKYAGQYGEAGLSNSDMDLIEIYPLSTKDRVLLDVFQDIEVVKNPTTIKLLYDNKLSNQTED